MKLDVSGKRVLVSGSFSRLDADDAEVALKSLGATIAEGLSSETDYLFAGDRSEAICHRAQELDIPILTEHALLAEEIKIDEAEAELERAQGLPTGDEREMRIRRATARMHAAQKAS